MKNNLKLITVTRRDLTPGQQSVQSTHAAIDFIMMYKENILDWHVSSNYLCMLTVENEMALEKLLFKCKRKEIKCTSFFEPDLNNQLTAICLEPTLESRKLTAHLPLLFAQEKVY